MGSPLPVVLSCEIIWKRNIILVLLRFLSIDWFHYILAPKSKHKDTCLKGLAMITCMQQGTWHVSYQVLSDNEGILRSFLSFRNPKFIWLLGIIFHLWILPASSSVNIRYGGCSFSFISSVWVSYGCSLSSLEYQDEERYNSCCNCAAILLLPECRSPVIVCAGL